MNHPSSSFLVGWISWVLFVLVIQTSYECNLRAYLMKVDFETPVDSEQDLLDKGWKLWLPKGGVFEYMFIISPKEALRKVGHQVIDNEQFFFYDQQGLTPIDLEKRIISEGNP